MMDNSTTTVAFSFHPRGSLVRHAVFRSSQSETLQAFQRLLKKRRYADLRHMHFDWWMFPADMNSRRHEFIPRTQEDVDELKADPEWLSGYRCGVRIVAQAWGWDVDAASLLPDCEAHDQVWDGWDIRLVKILRSLWLFEQEDYFRSMYKFAAHLHHGVKRGRPFSYGAETYDVFSLRLPRRAHDDQCSLESACQPTD
eukprot:NODE_1446_length_870_cov_158.587089_g1194_i0.p1 GENE.NODE_1446_length_870_cov_158.587089_g1194_i0~~NODE_1446_length_870_cov_158.587089_g1194_i0.p1  ORF type:complete len:198 (+),score=3.23 NODE_1446_length_870_cov_158.587089_g1194_i0:122-715(+)